jgi:glutathione S-transferase
MTSKCHGGAGDYLARLLAHPALLAWEAAALAEDFREPTYDAGLAAIGTVTADFRAVPPAPTSA